MSFCGFCFVLLHSRPTVQVSWNAQLLSNKDICIIIVWVSIRSGPLKHTNDVSVYLGRGKRLCMVFCPM